MSLYNVTTFEETSRQLGELWRTLDRVHDTLGQSTGATQVLTQQMSDMARIQGEQGKTLQTVLEQYKGVVQAQAATTMAVEENCENTARLTDMVAQFGDKLDAVSGDYMPATRVEALFEKQGAILKTICEQTTPIIEERQKRVETRRRWADGFEKWKMNKAFMLLNGLLICLLVGMIIVGGYYIQGLSHRINENTRLLKNPL